MEDHLPFFDCMGMRLGQKGKESGLTAETLSGILKRRIIGISLRYISPEKACLSSGGEWWMRFFDISRVRVLPAGFLLITFLKKKSKEVCYGKKSDHGIWQ